MQSTYRYTVFQHGYQLHHLAGTIIIVADAKVEKGNTKKEQSLLGFLSGIVLTKLQVDFGVMQLSDKARQTLLRDSMHELLKYSEYHIHSTDDQGNDEVEVFQCSGVFMEKLEKAVGL